MAILIRFCHCFVCVVYIRKDCGQSGGGLHAGMIPKLNRKHPTEPSFPVGIWPQSLHCTLRHKTPFPSSASSGILWNIPGIGWELCNSCCEETADQSCPVTMSKTAITINYFVLENTHAACLCYLFDKSMFWLLQSKKYY